MSIRRAERRGLAWGRYFRRYEPWHTATPGMLRAYDRLARERDRAVRERRA